MANRSRVRPFNYFISLQANAIIRDNNVFIVSLFIKY